uniref:Exported protein n=1 Tax=Parastrongyloides trichosuri TaxID=131310 RepID=A0A0N4ZT49_PARTI
MLQRINSRFLITASAISIGVYLCYFVKHYFFIKNVTVNKNEDDVMINNEISNLILDSNDVSTASLPHKNSENYYSEQEDSLILSDISKASTAMQNDDDFYKSLSVTQYHSTFDDTTNFKKDNSSDKDSIYSNCSCETAVGFKTPFLSKS